MTRRRKRVIAGVVAVVVLGGVVAMKIGPSVESLLFGGDGDFSFGVILQARLQNSQHFFRSLARGADDEDEAEALLVVLDPLQNVLPRLRIARRPRLALDLRHPRPPFKNTKAPDAFRARGPVASRTTRV